MGRSSGKIKRKITSSSPSQRKTVSIFPPRPHQDEIAKIIKELSETPPSSQGDLKRVFEVQENQKEIKMKNKGQVIGICGAPQAGKDVIAEYIESSYKNVGRANFSDYILIEVNQYLKEQGLNHEITLANKNTPLYRRLLQEWGGGRFKEDPDYWPRMVAVEVKKLAEKHELVVVTGLRSPADFKVVEEDLGGDVWRAKRPGNDYSADHEIENLAATRSVDREILNPVEGDLNPFTANIDQTLSDYALA